MTVVLEDEEPNGLASMLARLIDANLKAGAAARRPPREAVFGITASDAGVTATIEVAPGAVLVRSGAGPRRADVSVLASSSDLLLLASVPLRAGLPDPASAEGRAVLRRVLTGRVRLRGVLAHPARLTTLVRLLSVA